MTTAPKRHLGFIPPTRLAVLAVAAATLGASLSCGGKGGGGSAPGGFVPIDPNRPGDALFSQALLHFDAGIAAQASGFSNKKAGNAASAQTDFQTSQTELAAAQALFDQLRADATLCGATPTSIRCDASAYYGGRSSYEVGVDGDASASLTGTAAATQPSYQDAVARLGAMEAAYPGSWQLDQAAYFDARAIFHLVQAGVAPYGYADALAQFQRSLAASSTGVYADNAQYYVGRCWYELGFALVNVAVPPLPGSPDFVAASADFQNAATELGKVLARYPGSPYAVNARYYLGKTFFERPYDNTVSLAGRISDLRTAIGWFDQVIAANGLFVAGAHYWRGRAHYALAFDLVTPPARPDATELGAALLDLKAVQPPETYADNALYFVAKCYVNLPVVAPATDATGIYCTTARTADASPASACDAYTALKTLATTNPLYAGSAYLAKTQSYIQTSSPTCACTW